MLSVLVNRVSHSLRAKNGGPMLCERCGHEHERKWSGGMERSPETCIANLRADLEAKCDELFRCGKHVIGLEGRVRGVSADLEAERARSWEGWQKANDEGECYESCLEELNIVKDGFVGAVAHRKEWQERAAHAEAQCAAMRATVEGLRRRSNYFERPGCFCAEWVIERPSEEHKPACGAATNTLATDVGRDLLTAVRRPCEAAPAVDQLAHRGPAGTHPGPPRTPEPNADCRLCRPRR